MESHEWSIYFAIDIRNKCFRICGNGVQQIKEIYNSSKKIDKKFIIVVGSNCQE